MRSAFTVLDDNLVHLRAQYAQALPSPGPNPNPTPNAQARRLVP